MAAEWDVVEEAPVNGKSTVSRGTAWDVVDEQPVGQKRVIPMGEAAARGVGSTMAEQGNVIGLAASTPFMLADKVASIFAGKPVTRAQDWAFRNIVDPTKRAVEFYAPGADEDLDTAGTVANIGGRIVGMVPSMVAGGGAQSTVMLPKVADAIVRGSVVAQPSFNVPSVINRAQQLLEAGVDPETVAKASGSNFAWGTAMGAAPMSVAGGVVKRALTGGGINVGFGAAQRGTEGAILGPENARVAQPAFGAKESGTDLGVGAVMAALLGPRAAGAVRLPPPKPELEYAPPWTPTTAPLPDQTGRINLGPLGADPQKAVKEVNERIFTVPEGAPNAPDLQILPKDAPTPGTPVPDVSEVPVRTAPDWELQEPGLTGEVRRALLAEREARQRSRQVTGLPEVIPVDSAGRADVGGADGIKASMLDQAGTKAAEEAQTKRAFDVAEAQRARKQEAQDAAAVEGQPRNLSEARAGGTTTPEGTAATASQQFTYFRPTIKDGQMVSGERVEVQGEPFETLGADGKPMQAVKVRFMDVEGQPEMPVPMRDLKTMERPASPRFAQDVAATSYQPPKGVGTGEQQPAPRTAAQRITTETSPEFIPADRKPEPSAAPKREPQTYDMEGGTNASGVRSDQGQIPARRLLGDGGQAPRSEDLQRGAPEQPSGAQERPAEAGVADAGRVDDAQAQAQRRADVEQELRAMADEAGWAQWGGSIIRKTEDQSHIDYNEIVGRTEWIPHAEWFQRMRQDLARRGLTSRREIEGAVKKWLAGEKLNANQQRTIDWMLGEIDAVRENWKAVAEEAKADQDPFTVDATLRELREESTRQNMEDAALIARATEMDEAAVERAAIQAGDDMDAFMRAVKEVVNGKSEATADREAGPARREDDRQPQPGSEPKAAETGAGAKSADGGRPDFGLERPTEAGLRERAARDERERAERERVAKAPPPEDFTLTGSDRTADEAAARGQGDLLAGEQKGRGTTLYSGPPLGEMWSFAKESAGRIMGPAREWGQAAFKLKDAAAAVADAFATGAKRLVGKAEAKHGESVPGAIARMLFYNVHSHIKSFGEAWNSPTIAKIADEIYATAGKGQEGQSFHEATGAHVAARQKVVSEFAADIERLGLSDEQIIRMVENPNARQGEAGKVAKGIADWLAGERKYQMEAGAELGEQANYFPREYDKSKIIPRRADFIADATRAYRKMGMSEAEAAQGAEAFWFRKAYGSDGSPAFKPTGGKEAFTKARELTPQAAEELRAWRTESIPDTLNAYLMRSTRRAEIARRFGDGWAKWDAIEKQIIKESPDIRAEDIQELRSMVASAMGLRAGSMGVAAHTGAQYLRLWTTLATMPKAALSSIAETWIPLARANGDMAVTVNHLRNVLYENGKSLVKQALTGKRTDAQQELFDFAEDIGALSQSPLSNLMADRWMGGDVASKGVNAVTSKFFRLNMLEQMTNWQRAISVDAARIFLRRQAARMEDGRKDASLFLRELGVPEAKLKDFGDYVRKMGDELPDASALTGEMGQAYRNALVRFADQSIQRPGAATRPSWANTDWGAVVFQLQGFANAFHKNVLLRQAHLMKEGATGDYSAAERMALMGGMIPGLMLSAATAGLVWELRDRIYNKEPRERTAQAKVERAISGAGLTGALDPYLQMIGGIRYHRSPAAQAGGPSFGAVDSALTTMGEYWLNNSEKTNAAERRAMDTLYQWGIEPAATLALAATPAPVAPATQALTVMGIPASKQAFVDATAGPKAKKKEKPIRGIFEPK